MKKAWCLPMDLKGTIITADAMNCQRETVSAIIDSKGDYILALKENHPLFYKEVQEYFDEETKKELRGKANCFTKTVEREHGIT